MKKDINRNRKDKNLAGLYVVSNEVAYEKNGKLRKGVYGVVGKDTPYIYKPSDTRKDKPRVLLGIVRIFRKRVKIAYWRSGTIKTISVKTYVILQKNLFTKR